MSKEIEIEDFNLDDFNLENNENENKKKNDPLDELTNHDFSDDKEINLDESYEMLQEVKKINNEAKANEAENVIEDISKIYIDKKYKEKLDNSINSVKSFIKKYDINSETVKNSNDKEKTKLFTIGSFLNKNVSNLINELKFNIKLTREEYKLISSALEKKLTYDGNDIFNLTELNENYLKEWKKIDKSLPKNVPSFIVNIDIKNVVMLYHFLQKHTIKGINLDFYIFVKVLKKIADTNKLYNAYNIIKNRLDVDFNLWNSSMESIGANVPKDESQKENNQNVKGQTT